MPVPFVSRRRALTGLLSSGALTLAPWLRPRPAGAATIPSRLLIFFTYHGTLPQFWFPKPAAGAPAATETAYELNDLMQPFASYKDRLLILDDLAYLSAAVDPTPGSDAHTGAQVHALVGDNRASPTKGGNISIDQKIALDLKATRIPSLELMATTNNGNGNAGNIHYQTRGQSLPEEFDPAKVYARLFGSGATAPPTPSADASMLRRKLVVSDVIAEFDAIRAKLGKAELDKLDAHASHLRDLETSLMGAGASGGAAGCVTPPKSVLDPLNGQAFGHAAIALDVHARLTAAAFACDLTRVATINVDEVPNADAGYTPGAFGTSDSHDLAHKTDPGNGDLKNDAAAVAVMKGYHLTYAKWFAKVLGYLNAIPESDGKTLLDHTMVLWAGEIDRGGHSTERMPWVIAGGGEAGIRTGRYLRQGKKTAHNDLFVAIANAMGVKITTFGNAAVCKGALPGVLKV